MCLFTLYFIQLLNYSFDFNLSAGRRRLIDLRSTEDRELSTISPQSSSSGNTMDSYGPNGIPKSASSIGNLSHSFSPINLTNAHNPLFSHNHSNNNTSVGNSSVTATGLSAFDQLSANVGFGLNWATKYSNSSNSLLLGAARSSLASNHNHSVGTQLPSNGIVSGSIGLGLGCGAFGSTVTTSDRSSQNSANFLLANLQSAAAAIASATPDSGHSTPNLTSAANHLAQQQHQLNNHSHSNNMNHSQHHQTIRDNAFDLVANRLPANSFPFGSNLNGTTSTSLSVAAALAAQSNLAAAAAAAVNAASVNATTSAVTSCTSSASSSSSSLVTNHPDAVTTRCSTTTIGSSQPSMGTTAVAVSSSSTPPSPSASSSYLSSQSAAIGSSLQHSPYTQLQFLQQLHQQLYPFINRIRQPLMYTPGFGLNRTGSSDLGASLGLSSTDRLCESPEDARLSASPSQD